MNSKNNHNNHNKPIILKILDSNICLNSRKKLKDSINDLWDHVAPLLDSWNAVHSKLHILHILLYTASGMNTFVW